VVCELDSRAVVGWALVDPSRLGQHGLQPRMSRPGTYGDNAVAAYFFPTLKPALSYVEDLDTRAPAQPVVFDYLEVGSHRQRWPAAHGSLAPLASASVLQTNVLLWPEKC
jgi:transposase InsO family protein